MDILKPPLLSSREILLVTEDPLLSVVITNDSNSQESESSRKYSGMQIFYLLVGIAGILLNVIAILSIACKGKIERKPRALKRKPSSVLVVNLALISIAVGVILIVSAQDYDYLVDIPDYSCGYTDYSKIVCQSAFSMNTFFIIRDLLPEPNQRRRNRGFIRGLWILVTWMAPFLTSIPVLAMFELQKNPTQVVGNFDNYDAKEMVKEECIQISLWGSFIVTYLYELLRFGLSYVTVIYYMIKACNKLKTEILNLRHNSSTSAELRRRYKKDIRFIKVFQISFSLINLPAIWSIIHGTVNVGLKMDILPDLGKYCILITSFIFTLITPACITFSRYFSRFNFTCFKSDTEAGGSGSDDVFEEIDIGRGNARQLRIQRNDLWEGMDMERDDVVDLTPLEMNQIPPKNVNLQTRAISHADERPCCSRSITGGGVGLVGGRRNDEPRDFEQLTSSMSSSEGENMETTV